MDTIDKSYYKKISFNLLTIVLLGFILYIGQGILVPFFFAVLLASLLFPVTTFLQRKRFPKVLSIMLPLFVSLTVIFGILYFLYSQISHFLADVPTLKERVNEVSQSFQRWVADHFNVAISKQNQYVNEAAQKVKTQGPRLLGQTFLTVTEAIMYMVILPLYTFLLLYYKNVIRTFFVSLFRQHKDEVIDVIHESNVIGQRYITGLLIETCIVFTLNTIGFLILGIKYGIFLALLAALLNNVPYIGMIIANVFCMLVTLLTSNSTSDVLWVAAILAAVQIFDNNFGMPMIVGNKVKINALVTIMGVLIGGALCGIPGMFLAIPALAFLKVVFDRVEPLHPWGILLGDDPEKEKKENNLNKSMKPHRSRVKSVIQHS